MKYGIKITQTDKSETWLSEGIPARILHYNSLVEAELYAKKTDLKNYKIEPLND